MNYRIANQSQDYYVVLLDLSQPHLQIVVKLAGPVASYTSPFEKSAQLNNLVAARTSIPMPEIIAADDTYQQWPWRFLIKTALPGQEWMVIRQQLNRQEQQQAYRQLGNALTELHSIQFNNFGEFNQQLEVVSGSNFITALQARARLTIKNERLLAIFLSLLATRTDLFNEVKYACLCHEDLHGHNVLFQRTGNAIRLTTILDFDKAWSGNHEIDLARMELWHGMTGTGFWENYRALFPQAALYPQRRPIYQLLWCFEYAADTPAHLADTRRLCKKLGLPVITSLK